jgi:hypothetical protein
MSEPIAPGEIPAQDLARLDRETLLAVMSGPLREEFLALESTLLAEEERGLVQR